MPTVTIDAAHRELPQRLLRLRDSLLTGLVERDVAMRLALLAALAGEHLLLLGPPGTAKSLLARRLRLAFEDAAYFERLLTRFSVPEELFGPLSIKALEADRYERLVASYLPSASIAFLDEIFKANSAILNALLTLLNEREFDNGVRREKTPLISVVGASNELPEGEELDALYDRFLLRLHVSPVSPGAFRQLLALEGDGAPTVPQSAQFSARELERIRTAAAKVEVPADVTQLLVELRAWCEAEKIAVSDRRWRKIVKLLKVSAYTNRRTQVSIWDAWLLQHCIWTTPEQRTKVYEWYEKRVGVSAAMDPSRLTRIVTALEAQLRRDQESRTQMRDGDGQLLFRMDNGSLTRDASLLMQRHRGKEPLYLAPANTFLGHHSALTDRTKGNQGYTRAELDSLTLGTYYNNFHFHGWAGRDAYLADANNWLTEQTDIPPAMEQTRQKAPYVEARVREMDERVKEVADYRAALAMHARSLEDDIRTHLWVTPDFLRPATQVLRQTEQTVKALAQRVTSLRDGFARLPVESDDLSVIEGAEPTKGAEESEEPNRAAS